MWKIKFTEYALENLNKIDQKNRSRILKKIQYFVSLDNPLSVAKHMVDSNYWQRRRRIWEYRVIFDVDTLWKIIIVVIIGHRSKIYK